MSNVEARYRNDGKIFAILVDSDKALSYKEGKEVNIEEIIVQEEVYTDIRKGKIAAEEDLLKTFGTTEINAIAEKILKHGDMQIPTEYKNQKREEKLKQIITFLTRNATDPQTGRPHSSERIKTAIEQAGINVEDRPIEEQIPKITEKLKTIIPIKIETKHLKITIPASYTGRAYSILKEFKEKEDWLNNGDLVCTIKIPSGMQMDFYDKLNGITHGAAIAEEIKE